MVHIKHGVKQTLVCKFSFFLNNKYSSLSTGVNTELKNCSRQYLPKSRNCIHIINTVPVKSLDTSSVGFSLFLLLRPFMS